VNKSEFKELLREVVREVVREELPKALEAIPQPLAVLPYFPANPNPGPERYKVTWVGPMDSAGNPLPAYETCPTIIS
jgi:hypothetical protein